MSVTNTQLAALRFGAVMLLLAAVVLGIVAFTVDSDETSAGELSAVSDPTSIELPEPRGLGGSVTVYGATGGENQSPTDLGCRLLDEQGNDQGVARLNGLKVLGDDPIVMDGTSLEPLFAVGSYSAGWVVACTGTAAIAPIAVSEPSAFGSNAALVRAVAASGAVLCLLLGLVGWFAFRGPRT